jgi:hypothetical protein
MGKIPPLDNSLVDNHWISLKKKNVL